MSSFIAFYGASSPIDAALVYRTSTFTGTQPTWNAEGYDRLGMHDMASNTDRLTAPSAGVYRFWGNWDSGSGGSTTQRNVAVHDVSAAGTFPRGAGGSLQAFGGMYGPIMSMDSGDYAYAACDASLDWPAINSVWLAGERLDSGVRYCRVWNNGSQSIGTTLAAVPWDSNDVNTGGFTHSTVSNTSRISVDGGSGISLVRVSASIFSNSTTGRLHMHALKNGAGAAGLPQHSSDSFTGGKIISMMSAPIEVTAGTDYLELASLNSVATTLVSGASDARVWFQVEEIDSSHYINYQRVLAFKNTPGAINVGGSFAALSHDTEIYDTCGAWSAGDPTNFYVPSGAKWARCSWGLVGDGTGNLFSGAAYSGGGLFSSAGNALASLTYSGDKHMSGVTPWIPVAAGQHFQHHARASAASNTKGLTYFGVEFCAGFP